MILQLAFEFMKKIDESSAGLTTVGLGQTTEDMLAICKDYAGRLTEVALIAADASLVADKVQRKADGLKIHEREVPRSQLTAVGWIEYMRTYFKDETRGEMIYLLDHIVGVEKYERVGSHVSAKLVQQAGSISFEKSSFAVTGGAVSRQTVKNKVMQTEELAYVPVKSDSTPEILHIFADEDHVAMQNGRNHNLNLVTVTEGTRNVCKGRNELIEPMHIQGYKIKPEKHWEYVVGLCYEKYDMEKVKSVCIHGDGAEWIKSGTDHFVNAVHVLDGYHLNAYMKKLTSGEVCHKYASQLWQALREANRNRFNDIILDMMEEMEHLNQEGVFTKKVRSVRDAGAYIMSNWQAIQRRLQENLPGSCTEALVSHILSERFSRNPMGWSEAGLSKMAAVKVFIENGERVKAEHIRAGNKCTLKTAPYEIGKYKEIVDRQRKEFLSKKWDFSIFENTSHSMGLVTGTKRAYDALGKTRTAI
jgi:hypothetical protein